MKRSHRNKELSEVQYLKKQVQNLKSENRNLKKRLRQLEKQEHNYEELLNEVIENSKDQNENDFVYCNECKKGILSILDLKYIKYTVCDKCDYKEKV